MNNDMEAMRGMALGEMLPHFVSYSIAMKQ